MGWKGKNIRITFSLSVAIADWETFVNTLQNFVMFMSGGPLSHFQKSGECAISECSIHTILVQVGSLATHEGKG